MSPFELPVSVLLALWAPVPSSRAAAVVEGPDGAHRVLDGRTGWEGPLGDWLGLLGEPRRVCALVSSPVEPLPGLALVAPGGETVLLEPGPAGTGPGGACAVVPEPSGTSVLWRVLELPGSPAPFDAAHARREVHTATEEAIEALVSLDLARERPELADELTDLVTAVLDPRLVPPSLPARRRELLERSLRLAGICELALDDDGASVTALQAERRGRVLRPLLEVARRGVAAATETWGR